MGDTKLCDSLVTWALTFDVKIQHNNYLDFIDGVVMSHILHLLDPDYFNTEWLARIKPDVGDNYRLKTNNLRKVLNQMMSYFRDGLGNIIVGFEIPDVSVISEMSDKNQLGRMLQLMLGVAVNCPTKQHRIEQIMQLDENVQHVVMTAIQELMSHNQPCSEDDSANSDEMTQQIKLIETKLNDAIAEKDEMAQRCHELDMQVAMLHEEKANIQQENFQLHERLNETENLDDPSSPAAIRHSQMMGQIEALQEETYRLESGRDDFKLRCEVLEQEIADSQSKVEELSTLAEESRLLKDEIDYLRSASDKATKLESTIENYKTKLEELGDLRSQVKILEDKNTSYMEQTLSLEEELKKANMTRSQLEAHKRQVIDLHNKLTEETRRADKAEFESKSRNEKLKNLESEKQRLLAERDSLRETNDELQLTAHQRAPGFMSEQLLGEGDPMNLEAKERMIRLQHENKMLKLKQSDAGEEKINSLSTDLELANQRINELETENRVGNMKILELGDQVRNLRSELDNKDADSDDNLALRQKLSEHLQKLHQTKQELQKKKEYIESVEPQLEQGGKQINEMKEMLKKKEEDMKAMEDRYKKYLEKAKSVIRTLDPNKQQQNMAPQINKLKSEIQEKDKIIKQMEKEYEKSKSAREQEEKLIVNAWYNMGMQMHRKAVDERLSHTTPGQSFLARQRQVSSTRRAHPGSVQSYLTTA
ncbi:protein Hook homolog 3 isoform X2 [Ciona intestinalis]